MDARVAAQDGREAAQTPPVLTIWPETAVPFDYQTHALARLMREHAATRNTWLLFGAPGVERQGSTVTALYNRAYLIGPDGRRTC